MGLQVVVFLLVALLLAGIILYLKFKKAQAAGSVVSDPIEWDAVIKQGFMYFLAIVIMGGFFWQLARMTVTVVPPENKEAVLSMIDTLKYSVVLLMGYFFGTSKSSADKDKVIASQLETKG